MYLPFLSLSLFPLKQNYIIPLRNKKPIFSRCKINGVYVFHEILAKKFMFITAKQNFGITFCFRYSVQNSLQQNYKKA